jgi:hypothetical protein
MTAAKKLTAGNNAFLRDVKRAMNHKVYAKALALTNAEGEAAARAYVATFFRAGADLDAALAGIVAILDSRRDA